MIEYVVLYVPSEKIIEATECAYYSKSGGATKEMIASYCKTNMEYARRSSSMGVQFNFLEKNGKLFVPKSCNDLIKANKDQKKVIFRKQLQNFEPFLLFATFLSKNESVEGAVRKTKVIYSLGAKEEDIKLAFLNWGVFSGLVSQNNGAYTLNLDISKNDLSHEYLKSLIAALDNELKTKIYIAEKLTDKPFGFLRSEEISFFVKALQNHEKDARTSIDDAGKAFEDFLRRISVDKGHDVSRASGISEIADKIGGGNSGIISAKHLHICKCIGAIRVAAAHNIDKSSMDSWKINPDLALEVILLMLSSCRSIHNFVYAKIQMF